MGTTHFKSNIAAKGTVTISGFSSITASAVVTPSITGPTLLTATAIKSPSITGAASLTATAISAGTVAGTTSVTGAKVIATSYLKIGNRYIFSGAVTDASASVVAAASALVTIASLSGSLFLNTTNIWHFTATNTAATLG